MKISNFMKKIFLLIFVCFAFLFVQNIKVKAFEPLDEIELYEITINPREDGTLDMHFKIQWKVLDSSSQGPLQWIKIGVPNYHIDEIEGISDNIKKIYYYYEVGSFIRIDLDNDYYAGSVLDIEFSFHQTRIYFLTETECYYNYRPGYFEEIQVNKAIVKWNKTNVIEQNAMRSDDEYYIWESKLNYGETIDINVRYNKSSFINLDYNKQFVNESFPLTKIVQVIVMIVLLIIFVYELYRFIHRLVNPYVYDRGFMGRRYFHYYFFGFPRRRIFFRNGYNSRGAKIITQSKVGNFLEGIIGSSGGGSSCACACACAGGGRAGCSKKDFYKTNLQGKQLLKKLNRN